MKKYIVKDTIINLETKETNVYYSGKDGFVYQVPMCPVGYSRPCYALKHIKNEMETGYRMEYLNDTHGLENKRWLHIYEVVEIEQKEGE